MTKSSVADILLMHVYISIQKNKKIKDNIPCGYQCRVGLGECCCTEPSAAGDGEGFTSPSASFFTMKVRFGDLGELRLPNADMVSVDNDSMVFDLGVAEQEIPGVEVS